MEHFNFCFWACDRIRPPYQRLPSGHQRWHPCLRPRSRNPAMVRCQKNTFWIAALRPLKTDLLCTKVVQPWFFVKMIPCRQTISPAPVVWHFLGTFDFGTGPQHSTKNWIHFHDAPNFNDFVRVWLWIGNSQLNTTSGSQLYKCIKIFTTPHVAKSSHGTLSWHKKQALTMVQFQSCIPNHFNMLWCRLRCHWPIISPAVKDIGSVHAASWRVKWLNHFLIQNWSCSAPAARVSKRNVVWKPAQGWHRWFVFTCFHTFGASWIQYCFVPAGQASNIRMYEFLHLVLWV